MQIVRIDAIGNSWPYTWRDCNVWGNVLLGICSIKLWVLGRKEFWEEYQWNMKWMRIVYTCVYGKEDQLHHTTSFFLFSIFNLSLVNMCMWVWLCICIYICESGCANVCACIWIYVCVCAFVFYRCTSECMNGRVCICVYISVGLHVSAYVNIQVFMYICVYIQMYEDMNMQMYECVCHCVHIWM